MVNIILNKWIGMWVKTPENTWNVSLFQLF